MMTEQCHHIEGSGEGHLGIEGVDVPRGIRVLRPVPLFKARVCHVDGLAVRRQQDPVGLVEAVVGRRGHGPRGSVQVVHGLGGPGPRTEALLVAVGRVREPQPRAVGIADHVVRGVEEAGALAAAAAGEAAEDVLGLPGGHVEEADPASYVSEALNIRCMEGWNKTCLVI